MGNSHSISTPISDDMLEITYLHEKEFINKLASSLKKSTLGALDYLKKNRTLSKSHLSQVKIIDPQNKLISTNDVFVKNLYERLEKDKESIIALQKTQNYINLIIDKIIPFLKKNGITVKIKDELINFKDFERMNLNFISEYLNLIINFPKYSEIEENYKKHEKNINFLNLINELRAINTSIKKLSNDLHDSIEKICINIENILCKKSENSVSEIKQHAQILFRLHSYLISKELKEDLLETEKIISNLVKDCQSSTELIPKIYSSVNNNKNCLEDILKENRTVRFQLD